MINWGIIGLWNMANRFASSISEVKNSKLLGIASKNFLRLKSFGDKYNIEKKYRYNNYDEYIEHQKKKTCNPIKRKKWLGIEWNKKNSNVMPDLSSFKKKKQDNWGVFI